MFVGGVHGGIGVVKLKGANHLKPLATK